MHFILCFLAALIFLQGSLSAGQPDDLTPRQREILRELEAFRLPGYADTVVWMLASWDSDHGLENLVAIPENDGNAAVCFKRLEELFPTEKDVIEQDGMDSQGVQALLEAARLGRCQLSPNYYPSFDNTEAKQPDFIVLRTYLQALLRRAAIAEQEDGYQEAEVCLQAALLCGRHLTTDRSSSIVYLTGLIFKLRGAQEYEKYLLRRGDTRRVALAKKYADTITTLLRACLWKANVGLGEFDGFASLPAIIRIATGDAEAFWRKEAVARLALLRHGVLAKDANTVIRNPANEKTAEDVLAFVAANDPDPSVRRFAVWAAVNLRPKKTDDMEHRFQ